MKNTKKKSKFKSKSIRHEFTGERLTQYTGLSPIMKYLKKAKLPKGLNEIFPTEMHNSTKFSNVQILLSVVLASLSGVHRLKRIAHFTRDALVMNLLGLEKGLNKDVIGVRLKRLGQRGSIELQEYILKWQKRWLSKVVSDSLTIDTDSTVQTVYGNQQGAAKGYNPHKKGAKSYHPLLAFSGELKVVLNSWFRTGSAYTSNGICEFIKQIKHHLPKKIKHIFFRADSGFFNGALFDLLEGFGWDYLVKVKLKNLASILKNQQWTSVKDNSNVAVCEFEYKGKDWKRSRKIRAVRTVKRWVKVEFMGKWEKVAEYEYACYCSNLDGDALELHENYKRRSVSETWIEEVKSQLLAGKNLTDNFYANDILWQLQVLAYNISVMIRYKVKKYRQQEHKTLRDWFINIPGKLISGSHQLKLKIYEHYYYKNRWVELDKLVSY